MPYEFYKFLHVVFVINAAALITLSFFAPSKIVKILTGVSSLMIFVAGMGLLARIGYGHGEPWPLWIKGKIAIWVLISALGPILSRRVKEKKKMALSLILLLLFTAAFLAVYKIGA